MGWRDILANLEQWTSLVDVLVAGFCCWLLYTWPGRRR